MDVQRYEYSQDRKRAQQTNKGVELFSATKIMYR
jgi:hypothetical protein